MQAPQNLVCTGESQEITLSYAGSNVEKVMGSVTFKNDRQKASVSVYKQDKETRKYLPGGTYGLYAGNDIKAADGTIVVKKDTLIEKAVTGIDGKAVYQADLPIANSYYMKELGAPAGYVRTARMCTPLPSSTQQTKRQRFLSTIRSRMSGSMRRSNW